MKDPPEAPKGLMGPIVGLKGFRGRLNRGPLYHTIHFYVIPLLYHISLQY